MIIRAFAAMLLAAIFACAPTALLAGARVSPMIVNVEPSGRAAVARVEVTNPGEVEFPLEVVMSRGEISESGELTLIPADDQFLVYPAQGRIAGGGQQVFRIQYVGEPKLTQSEIYYMSIRQIPVELQPGAPRVQIVATFNVLVNVVPKGASAAPAVLSAQGVTRAGKPGIEVKLANNGTRYFSASDLDWSITGSGSSGSETRLNPKPAELSESIGYGVVPPGKTRIFFLPTGQLLSNVTVRLAQE